MEGPTSEGTGAIEFSLEMFAPVVGETFTVSDERGSAVELILAEATPQKGGPPSSPAPFSLLFHGPADPLLPQATYRFQHGSLGAAEIFIVPLGRDEHSAVYEAVFS